MNEIVFNSKQDPSKVNPAFIDTSGNPDDARQSRKREKAPIKERNISPERYAELGAKYAEVCIHDYGDEYHMSEEDRAKRNKFYEAYQKVARCKRKFRNMSEFIKVLRLNLEFLNLVAAENAVYDPDEFVTKVLRGDLTVYGLAFPKYIGKDKKHVNWDYVTEVALDPDADPSDIFKDTDISPNDDMSSEELYEFIFDEDERAAMEAAVRASQEDIEVPSIFDTTLIKDKSVVSEVSKKESKLLMKEHPSIFRSKRDMDKKMRKMQEFNRRLGIFAFDMSEDDYEEIERRDRERGIITDTQPPVFTGDLMNDRDYKRYMYEIERYEREHTAANYGGKMRTLDEIEELKLKDALEQNGWNLRKLYRDTDADAKKKLKKAHEEQKKREEAVKNRILALQNGDAKAVKKGTLEFDSKKRKKKKKTKGDKK